MKLPRHYISILEAIGIDYELVMRIEREKIEQYLGTNILASSNHRQISQNATYYCETSPKEVDKFTKYLLANGADKVEFGTEVDATFTYNTIYAVYGGIRLPAISHTLNQSIVEYKKSLECPDVDIDLWEEDLNLRIGSNKQSDHDYFTINDIYVGKSQSQSSLSSMESQRCEPKDLYMSEGFAYAMFKYFENISKKQIDIPRTSRIENRIKLVKDIKSYKNGIVEAYKNNRRVDFTPILEMMGHPFVIKRAYKNGKYILGLKPLFMYFEKRWYDIGNLSIIFTKQGHFSGITDDFGSDYPHPHVEGSRACTADFADKIESSKTSPIMHIYTIIQYLKNYNPGSPHKAIDGFERIMFKDVQKSYEKGECFLSDLGDQVYQKFIDGEIDEQPIDE